jgi:hypothetical protein
MGELMQDDLSEKIMHWIRSHFFGKYRGIVTDNSDETSRGRLKVKVPAVLGDLELWAMPCVPYAGAGVGFYSLPDSQTGVWIEFEGGDPSYPVWTGFFWADDELPDDNDASIKIWKTASLTIRLDDDAGEMLLENEGEAQITLGDDIEITKDPGGVTVATDGVTVECSSSKIDVGESSVSVNDGALEVE